MAKIENGASFQAGIFDAQQRANPVFDALALARNVESGSGIALTGKRREASRHFVRHRLRRINESHVGRGFLKRGQQKRVVGAAQNNRVGAESQKRREIMAARFEGLGRIGFLGLDERHERRTANFAHFHIGVETRDFAGVNAACHRRGSRQNADFSPETCAATRAPGSITPKMGTENFSRAASRA